MSTLLPPPRCRRPATAATADDRPLRILLLHGMGGGVGVWDPLDVVMPSEFELWDVEFPWSMGAGPGWALDADVARWIRAAVDGFAASAVGPPDLIVAHSFAANAALEAAGDPGGPGAVPTALINPFYRAEVADFEFGSIEYYTRGFHRMLEEGLRLRGGDRFTAAERTAMAAKLCDLMGPYPWLRFYDTFLRTPLCDLTAFTAPTLLVGGGLDQGAQPEGVRALGKRIPAAWLEILEDCGHFPMIEQPDRLAALLADFARDAAGPDVSEHEAN